MKKLIWKRNNEFGRSYRVIRGGSWYNVDRDLRTSVRSWDEPDIQDVNLGFCCVRQEVRSEATDLEKK